MQWVYNKRKSLEMVLVMSFMYASCPTYSLDECCRDADAKMDVKPYKIR